MDTEENQLRLCKILIQDASSFSYVVMRFVFFVHNVHDCLLRHKYFKKRCYICTGIFYFCSIYLLVNASRERYYLLKKRNTFLVVSNNAIF